MEADVAAARAEREEAIRARHEAEDRAGCLQLEVNRLLEELRRQQETARASDAVRGQLDKVTHVSVYVYCRHLVARYETLLVAMRRIPHSEQ